MQKPVDLQVYGDFLKGQSIAKLSGDLGLPAEGIENLLRTAARCLGESRVDSPVQGDDREEGRLLLRIVRRF